MKNEPQEISEIKGFELVLDDLRGKRGPRIFKRWFSCLKIHEKSRCLVVLTAPTNEMAEEISILFGNNDLINSIRQVWPEVGCIRIKPENKPSLRKIPVRSQMVMELAA